MAKKLRVWLPDDWTDISSENPEGPATFCWTKELAKGAFQVSLAEYQSGEEPEPSEGSLVQFAVDCGEKFQWGQLQTAFAGEIPFGHYGSAVFIDGEKGSEKAEYSQVWCLSNGVDFIFATFLATNPLQQELDAAQQVAEALNYS